jgi:hypothetical protein
MPRIFRRTTYFAPEFEPPEWRGHLIERIPRRSALGEPGA